MFSDTMKQDIAVVGSRDFVVGFQLAGVKKTFDITQTSIPEVMKDQTIGILILDQRDVAQLPEHIRADVEGSVKPTTVIISEDASSQEALRKMVKKSIGVDVWEK